MYINHHKFQMIFSFFSQCVSIIESCQKKAELLIKDLDLHVLVHTAFGKLLAMSCCLLLSYRSVRLCNKTEF